ncbi:hypothetical protein QE152_g6154 [Popillia japonica]|uniref:Uncharacterized protein n=1 Tax=Popillia japonica TaxID=7064 RepID=A0AAW1MJZ0_POPJA
MGGGISGLSTRRAYCCSNCQTSGLGDVDEQDIEELLHTISGEGLTNNDLQKLAEQGIEEGGNSGSEYDESKEITTDFFLKSLETITEIVV